MRILFAAIPAYGHLYPLMPLALAASAAGHEVTVATGPPFLGRLPLLTVPVMPNQVDQDWAFREAKRRHPEAEGWELAVVVFSEVAAELTINGLLPHLRTERPDLVVFEALNAGAGVAADALGIPALAVGITLGDQVPALIHARAMDVHRASWTRQGRRPPTGPLIGAGLLTPTPPSLWRPTATAGVPCSPLRPVPYADATSVLPGWLLDTPSRPRVYVTLGTVSYKAVTALRRAVTALAAHEVDVLVAVGADGDPHALGPLPPHVHVERFVAQADVLPRVDLVIHHGGTGTVLGCLASGLPQVLTPQGADQFLNADLLTAAGAARVARNDDPDAVLFEAVDALLEPEAPELGVAAAMAAEIAEMPAPGAVVSDLEAAV